MTSRARIAFLCCAASVAGAAFVACDPDSTPADDRDAAAGDAALDASIAVEASGDAVSEPFDAIAPDSPGTDGATDAGDAADAADAADVVDVVDTMPPVFSSTPIVVTKVLANSVATSGQLTVSWTAASDDTWPASALRYEVCWATDTACQTSFVAMATTLAGALQYDIVGLTSNTPYNVSVRARDGSNNVEAGSHPGSGKTAVSYATNIQAEIFNGNVGTGGGCNTASCHSTFFSRSSTVDVASCGGFFIRPNSPTESLIYKKMNNSFGACGTGVMPPTGANATLIQTMLDWINQGALNN